MPGPSIQAPVAKIFMKEYIVSNIAYNLGESSKERSDSDDFGGKNKSGYDVEISIFQ